MRGVKPGGLVFVACLIAAFCLPAGAAAGPSSPTKVSVSLGDSFISGEAGRWSGNSLNIYGTRSGTDRAAYNCTWYGSCSYDATRVYGSSFNNDCDRSDVAPIKSAAISVSERINIACSGAQTRKSGGPPPVARPTRARLRRPISWRLSPPRRTSI